MRKFIFLFLAIPLFANTQIISKSDLDFTESGVKKLKKTPKKIYIKEFNVGYQYMENASAESRNNDNSTETISMSVVLNSELTTGDVQSITDKAYNKFSKQLIDAGFELVGEEEASKIPFFQSGKITKVVGGIPVDAGGYIYTLANGTTRIDKVTAADDAINKTQKAIGKVSKAFGDFSKIADVGKKETYVDAKVKISEELGIPVLEFGINFNFLQLTTASGAGMKVLKGTTGLNAVAYRSILINKGDGKFGNIESFVQIVPKKNQPLEIEGVVAKEKISKLADAKNFKGYTFGTEYRQDKVIEQTKLVDADKAIYIERVTQALDEYLNTLATTIIESFN